MNAQRTGKGRLAGFFTRFSQKAGGSLGAAIWTLAAFVTFVVLGFASFVSIEPGQVAVKITNFSGSEEVITQPGLVFRMPFGLQSVYVIDASPQTFAMKGDKAVDELHVQELTVRASDGSNFLFNDTTIIFQVLGSKANDVLRDSGPESSFRMWMRPYARAILRDEFGRESTISVSNPAKFGEATERARVRLNEFLEPHGVTVTKIVTPRPRFNQDYENLIESRNEAENQLSVIASDLARAETERVRTLAEVDRDQNRAMQQKRAELEGMLATAVTDQAEKIRQVDTYRIETVALGQAAKSASVRQAEELTGQLDAEYLSKKAAIDAFQTQPVERVMERLGEKLKGVTIDIQPWANDPAPSRVELSQVGG